MGRPRKDTTAEKVPPKNIAPVVVADPTVTVVIPDEFAAVETRMDNLMLKNIGDFIAEGLNEEESCLMANFDYDVFQDMKAKDPKVFNYIRRQLIKLKQKHLRVMQSNPSDKNSQWILEKVFPEEFGNTKKKDSDNPFDMFAAIIKHIQHDPTSSIINATAIDTTKRGIEAPAAISVSESLG